MEKLYIKITGLDDGEYEYDFNELVKSLDLEQYYSGKIAINIKLQKRLRQIITDTELRSNVKLECDRCGTDFETELVSNYKMVYLLENIPDEENELPDIKYLSPETDKINIAPEVHDYAILSMPMKKLCSESCKGICPKCGKDLNFETCNCSNDELDPRWKPLIELKTKLNNK